MAHPSLNYLLIFGQSHIFTLIPKCGLQFTTRDFTVAKGFSILFHRQHRDTLVLAQRTGVKFGNKHTFPLILRHCHTATTGDSDAAV